MPTGTVQNLKVVSHSKDYTEPPWSRRLGTMSDVMMCLSLSGIARCCKCQTSGESSQPSDRQGIAKLVGRDGQGGVSCKCFG